MKVDIGTAYCPEGQDDRRVEYEAGRQIGDELGNSRIPDHFCRDCQAAFREYIRRKYQTQFNWESKKINSKKIQVLTERGSIPQNMISFATFFRKTGRSKDEFQ